MNNTDKKPTSLWGKLIENLKEWAWYIGEHPDWLDLDIQGFVKKRFIAPVRRLVTHLKNLGHRRRTTLPETESRTGQLLLFAWGNIPHIGCLIRERLQLRRHKSLQSDHKRQSFLERIQIHPAGFMVGALGVAAVAVALSLYTLGTTASYNGVSLGTVSNKAVVTNAVAQVESVTREALADQNYTIDQELLDIGTQVVLRTDVAEAAVLEENLSTQIGLVDYGYCLYVDGELVAATTFPGALEELLEQLQTGYHTVNTVECGFVEKVEIRQEFVDSQYMMNLGEIARILNDTKEGAVSYTVKSGDSLYGIAAKHDMSLSKLRSLNPGYSSKGLHPGDVLTISNAVPYLTVLNVERQNYVQNVAYDVEYQDDPNMYQGDYRVLSKGVYGKADITANVTFRNGTEIKREVVASVTLSDPVSELQARGTKPRPSWYPTGSFRWPCSGVITEYFGYRDAPTAGASTNHNAIDIGNRVGTPLYAVDGGTVVYAGWNGGYGLLIRVEHNGTGFTSYYAHCNDIYVSVGDHVYKGEVIGEMGNTGISTGPHLHFGLLKNGTWVNPLNYLP